jgi:hypothetical protein|tara:strand:- start:1143 stop:1394 length:252 start_codon:yes stop_codon:yes gene_type:complete
MIMFWVWILRAISGSIIGNASATWFKKTPVGLWFYKKVDGLYNWAADRYGFEILKSEDKWRKKYPNIANKVDELEKRITELEK